VQCNGPIDLVGIVQGQAIVDSVVIDGLELSIWPKTDGSWSLSELFRGPSGAIKIPTVQVRSGFLRIGHPTGEHRREIICHDLQGSFVEQAIATEDPLVHSLRHEMRATLSSSYFSLLELHAVGNLAASQWDVQGTISKLDYSSQLSDQLPGVIRARIEKLEGFSGRLDTRFRWVKDREHSDFNGHVQIQQGRLLHPQVPYPLDQISGDLYIKRDLLQLRNTVGRSGRASVSLECDVFGFGEQAPLSAKVGVRNLALDEQLYNALPQGIQEHWKRLGVQGTVDASASIAYDGQDWDPHVVVRAVNGSVHADFFPYPIQRLSGDFAYRKGVTDRDRRAFAPSLDTARSTSERVPTLCQLAPSYGYGIG